jgi:hypothetical protein
MRFCTRPAFTLPLAGRVAKLGRGSAIAQLGRGYGGADGGVTPLLASLGGKPPSCATSPARGEVGCGAGSFTP